MSILAIRFINLKLVFSFPKSYFIEIMFFCSDNYLNDVDMQIGISLFPLFVKQLSGQMQNAEE